VAISYTATITTTCLIRLAPILTTSMTRMNPHKHSVALHYRRSGLNMTRHVSIK